MRIKADSSSTKLPPNSSEVAPQGREMLETLSQGPPLTWGAFIIYHLGWDVTEQFSNSWVSHVKKRKEEKKSNWNS